ncbi:hypothetical protein EDS67_00395 [candidate division KSB1 bacterium]|nr:MAG: hypothetical protein EDS67_00395 [candidate division KSB1 bacterium]MBC6950318.1 hypothetical protein [candidate division KSB1 bacterium]MCE7940167.1 hypothetical protein [Chlorobi bacterium CHB1]
MLFPFFASKIQMRQAEIVIIRIKPLIRTSITRKENGNNEGLIAQIEYIVWIPESCMSDLEKIPN